MADRTSENPINDGHPFPLDGILEWEHTYPLAKVINSGKDLDFLLAHPDLLRNSITIIEPWDHVAFNHLGESVKASKKIAYIAQNIGNYKLNITAGSSLSWLLQLPDSIEILCSTAAKNGEIITECSATCINHKDFETKRIRRSFSCQFHPELMSDLRAIG